MKALKRYLITLGIGLALVLWFASARGLFHQTSPAAVFRILSDGFFVVGAVITAVGLLLFCSNEGTFDMLPYGMTSLADKFRKEKKQKYKTYYDYRMARSEKKIPFGYMLICGGFFLALALVLLLVM